MSDNERVEELFNDRLVFTLGVDSNRYSGITWFLGPLAGTLHGAPFEARMRYTRTWIYDNELGRRILAAHASAP
ncbi:hypothetical protein [Nonomuraea wenchangensis]|uniref:hypothetical protein n=1 Tax=Nonomuraea wenchangensis TaxID=568860 RepID=UPI003324A876